MKATRHTRRILLRQTVGTLTLAPLVTAAGPLLTTPDQTKGPFYPDALPLDDDNDLLWIEGHDQPAAGISTNLVGRVMTPRGRPVPGATVEIWQCNAFGRYHHPDDRQDAPLDEHFQGFGRTVTDGEGRYRFRTIRPVPYPGRVPHIHVRVVTPAGSELATQLYIAGWPSLERDGVYRRIGSEAQRQSVLAEFRPSPDPSADLLAEWDIVVA